MDEISRRDALSIMGLVPVAAALGTTPDVLERVVQQVQQAVAEVLYQQLCQDHLRVSSIGERRRR